MIWLQSLFLVLVAAAGAVVVLTRDPPRQAIALCFYGLLLSILFFLCDAPGLALAEIAFGVLALPLTVLLALARIRGGHERR
jgi:energy-converting hydrogenase B subunit D